MKRTLFILLAVIPAISCLAGVKDMQQVKRSILELQSKPSDESVKTIMDSQKADGSWGDIDYQDKKRSSWEPATHASRLAAMASAYKYRKSAFYGNKSLSRKIHQGMKYWADGGFVCANWWYNEIGVPKILGSLFLLMEDEMSKAEMDAAIGYMKNAKFGMTGQNSVWLAENVLVRAILQKDEKLFLEARDYIVRELVVSYEGEGIRPDMSFHQHGPQQQFGNYGLSYANTQSYWARLFKGTEYEFSEEQLSILHNYLVGGLQWTVWKGFMDIGSCGRQVVRNAQTSKARSYGTALENMIFANPDKADEYTHIIGRDIKSSVAGNDLTGYRFFPYSDYGLYRAESWSAGLKMSSFRTVGSEIINYENLLGRFLGNGGLFFYRTGAEYEDIFPVWDWTLVPGTTCAMTDSLFPGVIMSRYYSNKHDFVGGLSGDRTGVSAIMVSDTGLYVHKSYFFTDQAVVCLGSDIRSDNGYEITTSIDQKLQKGDVDIRGIDGGQAVYHDGMAYFVLGDASLKIGTGKATGSWNRTASVGSPEPVEMDVFSLWISHGAAPKNAAYSYIVFPDVRRDNWLNSLERSGIEILCNTEKIHAVSYKNILRTVFFESASMESSPSNHFQSLMPIVSQTPCIISIEADVEAGVKAGVEAGIEAGGTKLVLSVAEPTQKADEVILSISGKWTGKYCKYNDNENRTVITVPTANAKGVAVKIDLRK
ncbi:MAG: chondroitinase [Tannerella sp.]|jgi:chondroitin AC lyase|nr:chondroitinase [Tannerella sp.]